MAWTDDFKSDCDDENGLPWFRDHELVYIFSYFQIISQVQNELTPDRANIMISSKRFANECTQTEPWFQTLYSVEGIVIFFLCVIFMNVMLIMLLKGK